MVLGLFAAIIISFFSMFIPGLLLALALLRKTELHIFEIVVIGFIFGLIAPATMTWAESYLMSYVHAFSFSLSLFEANVLALTVVGAILCYWQGVFKDLSSTLHGLSGMLGGSRPSAADGSSNPEAETKRRSKSMWWVWAILVALMLITFYTRLQSIVIAPKFFEFDPYFDMIDTHYILTYGHQLLLDPSAWPVVAAGTNHRLQPLVPYLEAFWYTLVNGLQYHKSAFSTSLMSYVGSIYPPITAALLVFSIFVLLYHEYDERIGLIGAALTATMPVLFTTFIAGEQLVEPWGIFALFFFFATYMLAVRNPKDKRLAILAGIAFASNFLGAHYYTVTTGVLAIYIIFAGLIDILRGESLADFYKMNAIVIAIIILFYALYAPYQATLQSNLSGVLGIPIIVAAPLFALILIALLDFIPKFMASKKLIIKEANFISRLGFMVIVGILASIAILFTRIGNPIKNYIEISTRFTTPSKPLFMTVQEFIPTGPTYAFGSQGFGALGAGMLGVPIIIWVVCVISIMLICMSIAFRKSKTGILYIAIALPLMAAGFSEVKYLPHFGTAYIMLFGIMLGELLYIVSSNYHKMAKHRDILIGISAVIGVTSLLIGFSLYSFGIAATVSLGVLILALLMLLVYFSRAEQEQYSIKSIYEEHPLALGLVLVVGLFFLFGLAFSIAAIAFILIYLYGIKQEKGRNNAVLVVACVLLALFSLTSHMFLYGEGSSIIGSISAQVTYATSPASACNILSNAGNSLGYNSYCNTIPQYWLNAMTWLHINVGPNAPRVLAWWDYGDWINWFGNSNAVLRGDNSVATEDYAVAAQYVLGPKYNYTPQRLAQYMNGNQTRYVLFDQDLIQKWGALNFLGCVNINSTSEAFALAQGRSSSPPVPYVLGTSQCEQAHDPEFVLLPLSALIQTNQSQSINNYCMISNSTTTYISGYLVIGNSLENNTVCVSSAPNAGGVLGVYTTTGKKMNAVVQASQYLGVQNIQGSLYVEFLMIYVPNGPNGTITDAPSEFYNSNYYKGFILGDLPGFRQVYPLNATGINFINGTYPVRIFELVNYTGGLPPVPAKPSWITNNDVMP
ncbi:MAG: hypothetical protein KGI06_00455 [Candidatus Micrarchaeota archaeon]|nr:hypothetical protein [Candidatus Micrarchaeota archaeon]